MSRKFRVEKGKMHLLIQLFPYQGQLGGGYQFYVVQMEIKKKKKDEEDFSFGDLQPNETLAILRVTVDTHNFQAAKEKSAEVQSLGHYAKSIYNFCEHILDLGNLVPIKKIKHIKLNQLPLTFIT